MFCLVLPGVKKNIGNIKEIKKEEMFNKLGKEEP